MTVQGATFTSLRLTSPSSFTSPTPLANQKLALCGACILAVANLGSVLHTFRR